MNYNVQRFKALLNAEIDSVKLEQDENLHVRVLFEGDELKEINSYLKTELDRVYEDHVPLWNDAVENQETYRAVKIPIPDGGMSVYPAPIARIPADQVIASTYNETVRPRPIFSIDAYLSATYEIPNPQPTQPGIPPGPMDVKQVNAEDIAKDWEKCGDFIVRERINLPQKLLKIIRNAVCGNPYCVKVVVDPDEKTTLAAKTTGGVIVDLDDKYEFTKTRGDIIRWYLVPFVNVMRPLDEDDIDVSPWFGERTSWRPDDLLKKHSAKKLFLVADDAEAEALAKSTVDLYDPFRARVAESTQKKSPQVATQVCDTWLVWFYRTVKYKDLETGKTKIKKLNCLGNFHRTNGKLMDCYLNHYEHQCRPYELVDQMEDLDSTVGRMKWHQQQFTYAAHAEIRAKHAANHLGYWHDPNEVELVDFFKAHATLKLQDHVPGIYEKQWGTYRGSAESTSLLELMKFILTMSQLDSKQSKYSTGTDVPGRTPGSTMQQILERAEQEPLMFLSRLSDKLSRLLRLDFETRRQYQPLGELLPVWDDEKKQRVEIPFRFPVGDVMDNFRIALTAADEALAKEHDPEQLMMKKNALMQDGEYVAKVVAGILDLKSPLPASGVALFSKIVNRVQRLTRQLMGMSTTDEDDFDLTKEIDALVNERNAMLMMQQQQQAQMQQQQMQQGQMNAQGGSTQANPVNPQMPGGQSGGGSTATGGQPNIPQPPIPPAPEGNGAGAGMPVQ